MTRDPTAYRSADLVIAVVDIVYDADDPIPWPELVTALEGGRLERKTIENTFHDLAALGAIRITGHYTARRDSRALRPTVLGRHWIEHTDPPTPPHDRRTP